MAEYLVLGAETSTLGDFLFYLISFIVLVVLVKHFAWGPVMKMMDARSAKITDDLEYADSEREKAEKMVEEREMALKNSRSEAVEIVSTAKENGENQRKAIVDAAHLDAEAVRQKAQEDAKQAKIDAMNDVREDVTDISVSIASKLIQKELSANDQKSLVDSYIKELSADETK
ncbi:ATP synthase subunit b [Companilactobacillus sp. RD055328]|uniref:F0F1 ATP synthase subunit B n=1 Tax=Companilactobacillus sp. RD055328 TaxID=2916634 RepID=UPI001FC88394|nr:F0F1 ATP synthase subunit B [Companilactobacillus sp. RD055328]GKQ42885.1 ATP synthase subunit b [Companilactobacillus sp. RD055328]